MECVARAKLLSGAALGLALWSASSADAQSQASQQTEQTGTSSSPSGTTGANDTSIQDIIITANKREERLNRVGLTVTALSGNTLAERKITTLANISAAVPGLSFSQSSSNTPILTLRGVGFNSAALGSYPAVSVYVDQAPLPFPILALHDSYDVERIEVLKGPQGTLFGQNATGGAINFIAAKPTSMFEAGGDATYGRFNDVEANAYISGPITDTLRARVSGTAVNSNGWQTSNSRPYDRNGRQSYVAGRLILDWSPTDAFRFSLNVNGWIDRSQPQAPQFIVLNPQTPSTVLPSELTAQFSPEKPRAADWSTGEWTPRSNRRFYQPVLRADVDLTDTITATSITSYDHFSQKQTQDFDGVPIHITDFHENGSIRSFNQEVRLANGSASKFRWVVGGNYERSKTYDYQFETFTDNSTAGNPQANFLDGSFQFVSQKIRNIAGFANGEYDLTPKLTIKAGVRYTHSVNDAALCTGDNGNGKIITLFNFLGSLSGQPFTPATVGPPNYCASLNDQLIPNGGPTLLKLAQHNVSWRGGVDYKLAPDALIYANISRGYKAGSFPLLPASQTSQYNPVTQESVTAYEAGLKTDLFERRAHLNVAGFYYDYKNKQVLGRVIVPIFGVNNALVNVPKSRIFGVEGDLSVRPAQGLTLTGSLTYLNSKIKRYTGYDAIGNFGDLSGNKLPFAPRFSYNFDAEYRYRLSSGGSAFAGASVTGRSGQDTTISGSSLVIPPGPAVRVLPGLVHPFTTNPFATLDLRAGYEAPGGAWRVLLFGKNVLNKYYWTNVIDQAESATRYAGLPATYGVTVGFKFR